MVPADRSELAGVQAGAADEGAVNVLSIHDRRDIVALDGPAIQNTHSGPGFASGRGGNVLPDRGRHHLRVARRGDLAGADRPDRLPGDAPPSAGTLASDPLSWSITCSPSVPACRTASGSPTHRIGVIETASAA